MMAASGTVRTLRVLSKRRRFTGATMIDERRLAMRLIHLWGALALAFAIASTGSLIAQNTSIQRTVVQRADLSVPGREAVIARVVIGHFGKAGRHTQPRG